MSPILLLALLAGPEAVAEDCLGEGEATAEALQERTPAYVSPAAPDGKAEFDTSRRFYFDARKKMTAADFDAWLASIGARVVSSEETVAEATPVAEAGMPEAEPAAITAAHAHTEPRPASGIARPEESPSPAPAVEAATPAATRPLRVGR
jgi:hypothetical protein